MRLFDKSDRYRLPSGPNADEKIELIPPEPGATNVLTNASVSLLYRLTREPSLTSRSPLAGMVQTWLGLDSPLLPGAITTPCRMPPAVNLTTTLSPPPWVGED